MEQEVTGSSPVRHPQFSPCICAGCLVSAGSRIRLVARRFHDLRDAADRRLLFDRICAWHRIVCHHLKVPRLLLGALNTTLAMHAIVGALIAGAVTGGIGAVPTLPIQCAAYVGAGIVPWVCLASNLPPCWNASPSRSRSLPGAIPVPRRTISSCHSTARC